MLSFIVQIIQIIAIGKGILLRTQVFRNSMMRQWVTIFNTLNGTQQLHLQRSGSPHSSRTSKPLKIKTSVSFEMSGQKLPRNAALCPRRMEFETTLTRKPHKHSQLLRFHIFARYKFVIHSLTQSLRIYTCQSFRVFIWEDVEQCSKKNWFRTSTPSSIIFYSRVL
jgi:hypothetical protein